MAVTYASDVKNDRMTAVLNQIDAGGAAATLQIGTAGMALVLADIVLAYPCGTVSGGVLTFSSFPRSDTSANASGTAAAARIRDSAGNDVVTGLTVGTSGTDIVLDSTAISITQTVTLNSASITHAT